VGREKEGDSYEKKVKIMLKGVEVFEKVFK
jgi:hypothetical protein